MKRKGVSPHSAHSPHVLQGQVHISSTCLPVSLHPSTGTQYKEERDFFGHLLKTKAAQGLILVFYFWKLFVSHIPEET